jgi:hypothetical protein
MSRGLVGWLLLGLAIIFGLLSCKRMSVKNGMRDPMLVLGSLIASYGFAITGTYLVLT